MVDFIFQERVGNGKEVILKKYKQGPSLLQAPRSFHSNIVLLMLLLLGSRFYKLDFKSSLDEEILRYQITVELRKLFDNYD